MLASVMKAVPKLDKSESGQMVLGKVKLTESRGANDLESANSMDLQGGITTGELFTSVPYSSSLSSSPQCLCCACSLQIQQFLHQEQPAALNCHFLGDTPESLYGDDGDDDDDDGDGGGRDDNDDHFKGFSTKNNQQR